MVEYIPWSESVMRRSLALYDEGKMPTLDLELTAKCTGACCIYCDSKPEFASYLKGGVVGEAHPNELKWTELKAILEQGKDLGLEWVYTCGLGEPLEDPNFWQILDFIQEQNIRLSIFTNGVFIKDLFTAQRLKRAGVCIILKMDTFDEEQFDIILGRKGIARLIYDARDFLLQAGYAQDTGGSDLAFSIVPTALSINGIPEVVSFCEEHQIFASIGELEQAGEVIKSNCRVSDDLGLNTEQISSIKSLADKYAGNRNYIRPICPSILAGIHVDYIGKVIADRLTGLNCKWFLLNEPDVQILGDTRSECLNVLVARAKVFRNSCFVENVTHIRQCEQISFVFGGCGGNPKNVIQLAKEHL